MKDELKIPRMETIKRTAEIFGLPVHFVREKVNSGEVVAVRAGKKFLVNIERFADYLNGNTAANTSSRSPEESTARIMPISIR